MPNQPTNEPLEPQPASAEPASLDAGDLRSVDRLLKTLQTSPADPFVLPRREASRDEPLSCSALQSWAMQPLPNYPALERRDGFLAWLFLSLGLMAFACGAAMLVWSVMEGRAELWSYGVPLVLGGQGAVIFGLIGLAENAAQRQKQVVAALDEHRQRLTMMQNLALTSQTLPARRAA
jgi:uncharacterized membrane protein YidH (DUF202 family)